MLEYWSGRSTLTYTRTYTLNVCIAESANRARKLKYDILSFRMPIARKFTRSAVLRIDADASKSRLRLCNSMSIRAYHPFLPPRCDARCCQRGSRVAIVTRARANMDAASRYRPVAFQNSCLGWKYAVRRNFPRRDGIPGVRTAATEFLPSKGERDEIDSDRGLSSEVFNCVCISLFDHLIRCN